MKKTRTLRESNAGLGKVEGKNKYRIRVISAGEGSSGNYTEEALRDSGKAAFPIGTKMHADHQSIFDQLMNPAGSIKDLVGITTSEVEYQEDDKSLYTTMQVSKEWAPFVEQFAPYLGVSINALCAIESDENGDPVLNEENGKPTVVSFEESPLNTIDLVTEPGANGRIISAMESYVPPIDASDTMKNRKATDRKDLGMSPEDIQKITESLTAALSPKLEALAPKPVEKKEPKGPTVAEVAEAIVSADLPEPARKQVYAAVAHGVALNEAVKAQKDFVAQIAKSLESKRQGRVSTSEAAEDFSVSEWS